MIQHIVLFKLQAGTGEETIRDHMADFEALESSVPSIERILVRRDFVGREVSADFALIVSFAGEDALQAYQVHPEHRAAFERLKPRLDRMLVLDYKE
jgi:hypothetical protein